MIKYLLNRFFYSEQPLRTKREWTKVPASEETGNEKISIAPANDIINQAKLTNTAEETSKPYYKNPEIQALADECGGLLYAGPIEITLHRILEIIPRKRRRADAYKALKSELKNNYGVELIINSSRKQKKEKDYEKI